jgi:O-antigen/teichoic acid export membrane protein
MSKIFKNTSYLAFAFVGQKILAFIYFSLIARYLGAEKTGIYTFSLSYTTLFAMFADFGLSAVLVRESAKNKERSRYYLNNIITLKIIFALLTFIAIIFSINFIEKSVFTKILIYLSAFLMVIDSFVLTFWAVFRGFQKIQYEALSIIISQTIVITVGSVALVLGWPIYFLIIAFILGSSFTFVFAVFLLKKKLGITLKFQFDKMLIKQLILYAVPFALLGIFTRFYSNIDSVLLKYIGGEKLGTKWVGLYSVPYKITFALQFIPSAFAASLYPAMSNCVVRSKEKLVRLFKSSMEILMVISIPLAFGIAVLAPEFILTVYNNDYEASILALQILCFVLIFAFLEFPVGSLLNATNNQMKNTIKMGLALVINIVLNVILIPQFTFYGACLAALCSSCFIFLLGLFYVNKLLKISLNDLFVLFFKSFFSALIMFICIYILKININILITSKVLFILLNFLIYPLVGVFIYILVLYLSGGIKKEYIKLLFSILKRYSFFAKRIPKNF